MGSTPNDRGLLANGGDKMEPMAIIGMATKFPQEATSNENLWSFLLRARSAYTPFPKDRINADGHYHPDPEHGGTVSFLKLYKS
jgi:acyl transferase domain-containing protein